MEKENIYIDLSKCSGEERKHIFSLLPKDKITAQIYYMIRNMDWVVLESFNHLFFNEKNVWQICSNRSTETIGKTELTYPEFIKLFEGGEGENNGWIKIESEADLPKEDINCWWMDKKDGMILGKFITSNNNGDIDFILNNATHYYPIIKPEPPKF